MTRLPTIGGDLNSWGSVINAYLQVEHNADGTLKAFFNVKAFGATGNGSTDDTAAIQSAITAANAAGGGIVFFPPGNYLISSNLALNSYTTIQGSGEHATTITQSVTNKDCISGIDISNVSIRDITLSGPGSGSGHGINFTRSSNASLPYLSFSNVKILNFGSDGIALSNPIVSVLSRVTSQTNGGYGINLYGVVSGASGTSVSLNSCYGNANTSAGFRLYNMTYCALNACAADSNPIGYLLDTCESVSLSGCGGEANTTNTYKVNAGVGVSLVSCWTYDNRGVAIYITGSAQLINLIGCVDNSPHAGATNFIKSDSGTLLALVGCRNITANSLASSTPTTLVDASGSSELLGLTVYGNSDLQGSVSADSGIRIQSSSSIYSGSGAPSNSNGSNGDFYLRTDTPGTANQRIYVKSSGSWTGIV